MPDMTVDEMSDQLSADLFGGDEPEVIEGDEVVEKEAQPAAPSQEVTENVRVAPKSWAKEKHELWSKLAPEVQDQIELREKQALEGISAYKEHSDIGRQIREVAAPYQQLLEQQGVDIPKAVATLFAAHARLTSGTPEQRAAAYQELGRNLGLSAQSDIDPRIQSAIQAAHEAKQLVGNFQQERLKEARKNTESEVNDFAKDKPYFDEVSDDIVTFINAGLSLTDAYERAIWANPVTRAKEQERIRKETETGFKEKVKQQGTKARQASSVNIRSRDTGRTPTEPLGKMEDTLETTLKNIRERAH